MEPHIAILVLDTPMAGVSEVYGDFGDNFIQLLKGSKYKLEKYQVAFDIGSADELVILACQKLFDTLKAGINDGLIKAIVLSGSGNDSFSVGNFWIDMLDEFIQNTLFNQPNFPAVGICFGHQILLKNLGCKVNRNAAINGWELGTTEIALNKAIFETPQSPFRPVLTTEDGKLAESINIIEFHQDVVYDMPPSSSRALLSETTFQNIGHTDKCAIQGLVTESGPIKIFTLQGHPEFSTPQSLTMLDILAKAGRFDEAAYEKLACATRELENQGTVMGKIIQNFIDASY